MHCFQIHINIWMFDYILIKRASSRPYSWAHCDWRHGGSNAMFPNKPLVDSVARHAANDSPEQLCRLPPLTGWADCNFAAFRQIAQGSDEISGLIAMIKVLLHNIRTLDWTFQQISVWNYAQFPADYVQSLPAMVLWALCPSDGHEYSMFKARGQKPVIICLKRPSYYCLIHFYKRCVSALILMGRSP